MAVPSYGPKWRIITLILAIALVASYVWYSKNSPVTTGGTKMGLIYGFISLFLMFLLVYFGVRKRRYRSRFGTVNEWLQAHIWLGILSLFVVVAHTGFRFHDKVAVALFVVILVTILSGIAGALLYKMVPKTLTEVQSNLTNEEISDQLNQLAKTMARVASNKSPAFQRIYQSVLTESTPRSLAGWRLLVSGRKKSLEDKKVDWTPMLRLVGKEEEDDLKQLLMTSRQHKELHLRLIYQQRYKNILEAWLYIHLPLSVGMIALIIAHLYGVFYYGDPLLVFRK